MTSAATAWPVSYSAHGCGRPSSSAVRAATFWAATGGVVGQQQAQANPAEAPPSIPKKSDGTYDFTALTENMVNVKKEFPSESKVIVGAEGDIPYEVLVQTMDAIRETPGKDRKLLFTDVTLGAM